MRIILKTACFPLDFSYPNQDLAKKEREPEGSSKVMKDFKIFLLEISYEVLQTKML